MDYILVVEDDPEYRNAIRLILEMEGFEVQTAANGREGLESLRQRLPDLVLCDIMMPEMDGRQFLEALQDDNSTAVTPVIFVTALDSRFEMRRSMSAGADDYLTKPFSAEELIECVNGRLKRVGMLRGADQLPFDVEECRLLDSLTRREREVLTLVATGATLKGIASALHIRPNTVEVHRANLMRKLGVQNSALLGRWAAMMEVCRLQKP
ncbi:MAG TPA: response regulator transcription factor [Deltaproteobacteria bacterium]|nr:response regulator transcription factor [Deltaproteobacteria bacterium]HQB39721.1 response regulator transcription factor [Deltaproteobacteria bacterium]